MSWTMLRFDIAGIKGVLSKGGDLQFGTRKSLKSLGVFAPNGCGKSGYADAIEYFFSRDGLVEHLGKGHADSERGGKHALLHVLAQERGITPTVSADILDVSNDKVVHVSRNVTTAIDDPPPAELLPLLSAAHRVLRQHDLRRFVVDMEPGDKYAELSRWLSLERIREVLGHLKTAENALRKTSPDKEFEERRRDLSLHTNGAVNTLDPSAVFSWCREQAARFLGDLAPLSTRSELAALVERLREKRNSLITSADNVGRVKARDQARQHAAGILGQTGLLVRVKEAVAEELNSALHLEKVLNSATAPLLPPVWTAAERFLRTPVDRCPICETTWERTEAGSQEKALTTIRGLLAGIQAYREAEQLAARGTRQATEAVAALGDKLEGLVRECKALALNSVPDLLMLEEALQASSSQSIPPREREARVSGAAPQLEQILTERVLNELEGIALPGERKEVGQIDDLVQRLTGLGQTMVRLSELALLAIEYQRIGKEFSAAVDVVQQRAAGMVADVVKQLRTDVQKIYAKIHPDGTVPAIHIVPETESRALLLRVDFHAPGRTVPPAGYLSESQINTLGLALFLSAVRLFNRPFPFVFLDDIVSSYDAEHRSNIVDVIAEDLSDFQVLLTTHDRMFFNMLRARLLDQGWQFETIQGWSLEDGPSRRSTLAPEQEIERLFNEQERYQEAGNAVRRFMEEWLDRACAKFGAYTPHRPEEKDYERTLFDFWEPFLTRLNSLQAAFRERVIPSVSLQRLKAHPLINYYNHHRPDPYSWGAMGDVKYVWENFKEFRKLLTCASCGNELRYDKDSKKVYCGCGKAFLSDHPAVTAS